MKLVSNYGLAVVLGVVLATPLAEARQEGAAAKVTGTVAYRERIALLPGAVFEATLEDVSRADAKATVLGTARVENVGAIPIRFEIPYDPHAIDSGRSYVVRGRIVVNRKLAFTTDKAYPVLTRGAGNSVELLLVRARSKTPTPKPAGPAQPK